MSTRPASSRGHSRDCPACAEDVLQQQKVFIRQILDANANLIFVKDSAGRFVMVNQAMANLYGVSCDELVDRLNREVLPNSSDYDQYDRVDQQVLRTLQPVTVEETHQCADGQVIWFLTTKTPIQLPHDGMGVLGVSVDITHRRQAEEALRESRDRLALAIEAGHAGLALWNLQSGELWWNDRAFQILGREPNSCPPTYELWRSQVHPEDIADVEARFWQCAQRHQDYTHEHRVIRPNGEVRWVRLTSRLDYGPDGKAVRSTAVMIDITSLKQAEEKMRRAKEEAESAGQSKDQFLAVLSHELRTPLAPILTTVQVLEMDRTLSPELRESVELIRRNVELEARLIDDLLDLTRISRGKVELHLAPVDLHRQLQHVIGMCQAEVAAKRLRLMVEPHASHHCVQGDSARLQQVLWNLLKNAVKFTPEGGSITICTRNVEPHRIALSVQDTGIGIEPDFLPRLFNAFEQGGKQVTRQFGGLGLGLAISKGLVDLHGGTLTPQSDGKGHGATFTLVLPTVNATAGTAPDSSSVDTRSFGVAPCRILLVEDNTDTAKMMTRLLERYGFEVWTADSVASALQAAQSEKFELLLSDIGLPDGTGLDLMHQLRRSHPTLRGIAVSGYGMEEDIRRSKDAGFAAHLTKPVNLQKLQEVIRQVLV